MVATPPHEKAVITLHHSAFQARYEWNSRSITHSQVRGPQADELGDLDALGLDGLAEALATEGQRTPVDLRVLPSGALDLVCGFRRLAAVKILEESKRGALGLKPGEMRVMLHGMLNEFDARKLNLSENVHRQNLTGPEFIMGLRALRTERPTVTPLELGTYLGKSETYIRDALGITLLCNPVVLDEWCHSPMRPVTVDAMSKISKLPMEAQMDAYKAAVLERAPATPENGKVHVRPTLLGCAQTYGTYLGQLTAKGLIEPNRQKWEAHIGVLVPKWQWDKAASDETRRKVLAHFIEAFEKGMVKKP